MSPFRRKRKVRVRYLHAETRTECGAACVAMILKFYGRSVPLSECHKAAKIGRDGAAAKNLVEAAQAFGLSATALTVPLDRLKEVTLPAILHWEFRHFLVLEQLRDTGHAVVMDPASGRRSLTPTDLDHNFTGVVVSLKPAARFTRPSPWATLARSAFSARGIRWLMIQIAMVSLLLTAVGLVGPVLTKLVVDRILPQELSALMPLIAVGIVLTVLVIFFAGYLRTLLVVQIANNADARLMEGFFSHLLALPYSFFQQRSVGDLVQRLSSNAQIRQVLTQQTVQAVLDGVLVVVYGAILFTVSPTFGFTALTVGLLQTALIAVPAGRITRLTSQELTEVGRTQSFAIEALTAIDTVKASGVEDRINRRFLRLLSDQIDASMARSRFVGLVGTATATLTLAGPLTLSWVGATQVLRGSLTLGTMFGLISLSQQFMMPLTHLVTAAQQLQTVQGHVARLADVLVEEPEQEPGTGRILTDIDGVVTLEDVGFRFDATSPWALRHVNLTVQRGARIAIVGRSGSGKSTLARLLVGLYVPTEGTVRVDGHDFRELEYISLRRQFGVVMQDPLIFDASIRDNISLLDDEMTLAEIEDAAYLAALDDDIRAMPMGYETLVSEGGSALSGGQRQRVSLARAFCRHPHLLILDEATSSLDAVTEKRIVEGLRERRCSTVVIAHRLSTVRTADQIVVVDGASIAEQGTHEELMRLDGVYAQLVKDQGEMEEREIEEHGDLQEHEDLQEQEDLAERVLEVAAAHRPAQQHEREQVVTITAAGSAAAAGAEPAGRPSATIQEVPGLPVPIGPDPDQEAETS